MFKIASNGIITINRGDSFELPLTLNVGSALSTVNYVLSETDCLYLGIMEPNQPFEFAIIRKKFTVKDLDEDGNIKIRFWPEDTICLIPGKYYYQIKLETSCIDTSSNTPRKDVETIVEKTLFYIQE